MDHIEREQLRRKQMERKRPYEYGSDLHHLWAWGYRMQCWLDCDYDRPSRHLGILVYPYREAADALVRFSVKYPAIIRIIQDELDIAVEALEHCEEGPDQAADLGTAMSVLCRRIETGTTTIAQAEDELSRSEPSAPSTVSQTKGMSCAEATERLLSLRLQGLPYTSQPLLGKQIGCAASTVNKAIAGSAELRVWMERTTTRRSAPRAEAFSGVHQSNLPAPNDGDPSDFLPPEDVERILARLIAEHGEEMERQIDALDPGARIKFAAAYEDQRLDQEPSPLEPANRPRPAVRRRVYRRI